MINKIKYKHPWDCFYEKDKRDIDVPNISVFEQLYVNNKENIIDKNPLFITTF